MELPALGSQLTKRDTRFVYEDGVAVPARVQSSLREAPGDALTPRQRWLSVASFIFMPQTRAPNLGFTCPETVCWACSV